MKGERSKVIIMYIPRNELITERFILNHEKHAHTRKAKISTKGAATAVKMDTKISAPLADISELGLLSPAKTVFTDGLDMFYLMNLSSFMLLRN